MNYRSIARHQLDKWLTGLDIRIGAPPIDGWIRTIRQSLGLSTADLAERMSISQQRVSHLERAEVEDAIRVSTLRRAASALNCQLLYVFVPDQPLEFLALLSPQRYEASWPDDSDTRPAGLAEGGVKAGREADEVEP